MISKHNIRKTSYIIFHNKIFCWRNFSFIVWLDHLIYEYADWNIIIENLNYPFKTYLIIYFMFPKSIFFAVKLTVGLSPSKKICYLLHWKSTSKGNQTMKLGQLIDYNKGSIFLKRSLHIFLKNLIWGKNKSSAA